MCSLGLMEVAGSSFASNSVTGGVGAWGAGTMMPGFPAGGGGSGGAGEGGAIFNIGTGTVSDSAFVWNTATGGRGGGGGNNSVSGVGGSGGDGGAGGGSAIFGGGVTAIVNCTFAWNGGVGGAGGAGGWSGSPIRGDPEGGGGSGGSGGSGAAAIAGQCFVTNCTLAFNSGEGGAAGLGGSGQTAGLEGSPGDSGGPVSAAWLANTLLVANVPMNGSAHSGIDSDHNLWADNAAGIIGPLTSNGGPTLTMALPVGSPAIDAGDNASAPPTDQRGAARPAGAGADIGAYEAAAPGVVTPPQDCTITLFSTAQFSVLATGAQPLSYQWFFNATNLIATGPSPALQLTNVQLLQAGAYNVVITNAYGAVTSSPVVLTVLSTPPKLTLSPTNQTAWLGSAVSFQAAADGGPPLSFQWFFDGTNALPGATNAIFSLANLQPAQAGGYSVVVTNTVGAVTSGVATLTLTSPVVTSSTETALRAALVPGGTVTFASNGTITLGSSIEIAHDTVLDGTALDVTISGGGGTRVFYVDSGVHFTAIHVTIAFGGSDFGAGIYNAGGQLTLEQCRLVNNAARGSDGSSVAPVTGATDAGGGALYNTGTLEARACAFIGNSARGGQGVAGLTQWPLPTVSSGAGGAANGGALFNVGTATLAGCSFSSNTVAGGAGGAGAGGGPRSGRGAQALRHRRVSGRGRQRRRDLQLRDVDVIDQRLHGQRRRRRRRRRRGIGRCWGPGSG